MRVAITGATGFIGKALTSALLARGDSVLAYSRRPGEMATGLPAVTPIAWPPRGAFPAVDAVVHLVGEPVAGRWTPEKKRAIRETRVAGTRMLTDAIEQAQDRPGTLLSASATGYYGDRGEERITEESASGAGFLADVCREWEQEALRAEKLGVRVAMLRTGIVLAPDGGALGQMLPPFRMGLGGPIGDGRQWFSWIHRDDIVSLYLWLLDNGVSGPVNGTAPNPVRQAEFARALGATLHRPAIVPTPRLALKLMYGEFAGTLFESQRVIPEAATRGGFVFKYPEIGEALRAVAA